jgi:periplasmic divalent cation tolerance protein
MYIVIFITASGRKEAKSIASALVAKKLAACVNIATGIESIFYWQGKVDSSQEALLVVKSKKEKLAKIIKLVKSLHSYQLPEIIALPIIAADKAYLNWIDESLTRPA